MAISGMMLERGPEGQALEPRGPGALAARAVRVAGELVRGLVSLAYPPECALCGRSLAAPIVPEVCAPCFEALPVVGRDVCERCGAPQGPHVGPVAACELCRGVTPGLTRTVALGAYEGPLAAAVLALKYRRRLAVAPALGTLLAGQVRETPFRAELRAVVFVPLHWRRELARGFNQAAEIAAGVARALDLPVWPALRRTRPTASQTRLARQKRHANVREAFAVRRRFRRRLARVSVLVVDDVMTTGATLKACGATLRRAGARTYGAVACRTKR